MGSLSVQEKILLQGLKTKTAAGQSKLTFQDEGIAVAVTGLADTVNFTGVGVTASATGNVVTVNIPGTGGLGTMSLQNASSVAITGGTVQAAQHTSTLISKGTITSTVAIDWTQGQSQSFTQTSATNHTVTMTAPAATSALYLKVIAPAAGSSPTITWPASVKGSPPTTVTLAKYSDLHFHYDGTNYNYIGGCLNV